MKIQRIHIYNTSSRWIIFGSDALSEKFQILQISRDRTNCEIIHEDRIYAPAEIDQTIKMAESERILHFIKIFGFFFFFDIFSKM